MEENPRNGHNWRTRSFFDNGPNLERIPVSQFPVTMQNKSNHWKIDMIRFWCPPEFFFRGKIESKPGRPIQLHQLGTEMMIIIKCKLRHSQKFLAKIVAVSKTQYPLKSVVPNWLVYIHSLYSVPWAFLGINVAKHWRRYKNEGQRKSKVHWNKRKDVQFVGLQ